MVRDLRPLTATPCLLVVLCAASCRPEEPKRLPPAHTYATSDTPAEAAAPKLAEYPVITVTRSNGDPFEGCKVSAFEPTSHQRVAANTTDKSGIAHLDGMDVKRRFELLVEPPTDDADSFEASRTHSWPPSDTAVQLAALLTVEGRVAAADGTPAKGVAVRCSHAKGAVSVAVGDDGKFVFKRVPEGAVELAVAPSYVDAERGRCGAATSAKAGDRNVVLTAR